MIKLYDYTQEEMSVAVLNFLVSQKEITEEEASKVEKVIVRHSRIYDEMEEEDIKFSVCLVF